MNKSRALMRGAVAMALATLASGTLAGGLGIGTQSGSGTGNAFAGGSAAAEDASTVWYNPAGMSALPGTWNFALAAHALKPSFKFQNAGSTVTPIPGTVNSEGDDGGDWAYIPQGFLTYKFSPNLSFGAAFNTPFGLKTSYDAGWRGRTIALDSQLRTYNLNLAAAYKINDVISVGAGINYQKAVIEFNSQIIAALGGFPIGPALSDTGFGYNVGALIQFTPNSRLGLHYRSSITYQATGTFTSVAALGGGGSSAATAGLSTPDSFSISAFNVLNPNWDLMADVTWTGWSHLKSLAVVRTSGPAAGALAPGSPLTFNWEDTWRYSVGVNYKPSEVWKFRFGVALDRTPTNDVDRTARLPDNDRKWVAIGAQYRLFKTGLIDVGYAHEFIKDAVVNNASAFGGRLIGSFNSKADIFSVQYSQSF